MEELPRNEKPHTYFNHPRKRKKGTIDEVVKGPKRLFFHRNVRKGKRKRKKEDDPGPSMRYFGLSFCGI